MLDKRQRKKGGKELRLEPKRKRKFGQKKTCELVEDKQHMRGPGKGQVVPGRTW